MIAIGICAVFVALFFGFLAWRGRIVERGQFCRKCKFDLAGSSMNEGDRCPECGSAIHLESSRRTTLRRTYKPGVIVFTLTFLIGCGAIGFGIWGNPAAVYSSLPDAFVVQGVKWGSDAALDEATTRLTTSTAFAKHHHSDLINHALKIQADRSQPWDPRLGQILINALVANQFDQEQIESYALNGWVHTLDLRDKAYPGDQFIHYRLNSIGDRVGATGYAMTKFSMGAMIREYGVPGDEPVWSMEPGARIGARISISGGGGSPGTWSMSSLWQMDKYTSKTAVGDSIPIYIDLEVRLSNPNDEPVVSKITRLERSVTIVDPSEPIVQMTENTQHAEQIAQAISIGPMYTMVSPTPPGPNHYNIIMKFAAYIDAIPTSFAFKVYVKIGDEEVHIGDLVREGPDEEPRGQYVQWGISPSDSEGLEEALGLHKVAIEHGTVDVIFRADPDEAIKIPTIDEVIDATIMFSEVPLMIVETPAEVNNPDWGEKQTKGTLVTE